MKRYQKSVTAVLLCSGTGNRCSGSISADRNGGICTIIIFHQQRAASTAIAPTAATCNGCHHAQRSTLSRNNEQDYSYAPGETVTVTLTGGSTFRLDRRPSSITRTASKSPVPPATRAAWAVQPPTRQSLSAPAPTTAGTYTWKMPISAIRTAPEPVMSTAETVCQRHHLPLPRHRLTPPPRSSASSPCRPPPPA